MSNATTVKATAVQASQVAAAVQASQVAAAVQASQVAAAAPASYLKDLDFAAVTLTRSQKKAIAYASALAASGETDKLTLSHSKADNALGQYAAIRSAARQAAGNNNRVYSFIIDRIGSSDFAAPDNAKLASLFAWAAMVESKIRGTDSSTIEQVTKRRAMYMGRFSTCIDLIEGLREVKALA